jgi:multicomponent Na+:H+ antiporter subunit D
LLYSLLPNPVQFEPYTGWTLLQAFMLLGFTGFGFYVMKKVIAPHAGRNLDFDVLYRLVGRAFIYVVCKPISLLDDLWTEAYRAGGLRGLLRLAGGARWFDSKGIDTVVDGSAYTVRGFGRASARMQTGNLQDYLAWAVVFALILYGIVWWWS